MWSVTAAGPRLVAAGTAGDHSAAVWTSVDGITWSRGPHDEAVFGGPSTQVLTYERADVGGDYELIATTGNIEALGCSIIASDTAQFSTNDDPETYLANEVGFLEGTFEVAFTGFSFIPGEPVGPPGHPFVLADGSFREATCLEVGEV